MKNIISLLKESKVAAAILVTAVVFIAGSIGFVAINSTSNVFELEAAGKTFDSNGEVLFPSGTKYEKSWDGTANADGNKVVAGAPIIYDNKSMVNTEEGVVIFPDTSDVYVFDEFTQVSTSNGSYAIQEEGGTNVQSPEMLIKTKSDYHIFLSNNIEVMSNDKVVVQEENVLVTKLNSDGSVTLYGEENKNVLSSDLKIKTSQGLFDYSTLYYDSEVDTNLARITVGDNEVNKLAFKNNMNKPSTGDGSGTNGDGTSTEGTKGDDSKGDGAGGSGSEGAGGSSGSSSAGASGGINGLYDLFVEAENQKSITPPRIITSVTPGFSTVNIKAEVFDPSKSITGKIEFYLYDEAGNIVAYKEENVKEQIDVTFDSLTSDTKYSMDVKANYLTSQGDEFKGTFSSEHFRTSKFNLNITVPKQTESSLTLNVKTPKEQNITYAKIAVTEKTLGVDTLVAEYEIDLDQATSKEGETIQVDGLNSNTQYNITVEEVTIGGAVYDVDQVVVTQTLKSAPVIQAPIVQVDTFGSAFRVISPNIVDPDNSITSIQYQVYEVMPDGTDKYVTSVEKEANSINEYANIYIDGAVLKRNTTYKFKTVVKGYDNLNSFEIISDFSGNVIMQGVEPPAAIFNYNLANDVDFNKIVVDVNVVDKGSTIIGVPKLVIYKGTDKLSTEYVLTPGMNDDLEFSGLTSNTTYKLNVVADINLQDGAGIRTDAVIGEALITTKVIGTFDVAMIMDPYCPLIDPTVPDVYDSCINEDGAVVKMNFTGDTVSSIKTLTFRILDSSNNVVVSINVSPPEIEEIKQTGIYRLNIPAKTLKSNQKYTVEIYQVTDSANNLPFTVSTPNDFRTKKVAPSVKAINANYNEDQGKILVGVDQFKDVDSGFQKMTYELYTFDSKGDLDKAIKEENLTNQNNLSTAFIVDGTLIPRGTEYAVKTSTTYNNNYFTDTIVLDTSVPIVVDYLRPKTKIENIAITDKSIDADVTVEDADNAIGMVDPSKTVKVELKDETGATVKSKNISTNTTTKVSFDGLTPSTNYSLYASADVMTLNGKITYNLLDFKFTTKINQSELPTVKIDNLALDFKDGRFNYTYSIKDQHTLITSSTMYYVDEKSGDTIYSSPLHTTGTSVAGDQDVKIPDFKKNVDYNIFAQLEYVEPSIESFNTVDLFQLNDKGRVMSLDNGAIRATNTPNIQSKVKIESVPGFAGQYRFKIGTDANTYITVNNSDQLVVGNMGNAAKFEIINVSGQYVLKEVASGKYVSYDKVVTNGYKLDASSSNAIRFSLFKVKTVKSNEFKVNLPAAPAPTWQTLTMDVASETMTHVGLVDDPYNLITPSTLYYEVWDMNGNRMYRKEIQPETEETLLVAGLKPMTEYKVVIKGSVDKQEINSKPVDDTIIYEQKFETDPIPPPFNKISAEFDVLNRNIIIEDDLVDISGVYDAVIIDFYESGSLVYSYNKAYKYVDGQNTTIIGFQSTPLEVNKTYQVNMQFKSARFSDSKVVTTTLSTLYPMPTASFSLRELTDTHATFDSMYQDKNKLIIKDTAIVLANKTNPSATPKRINVSQTEMTRTTFEGLEASSVYRASLVAVVDIDGKGTQKEVEVAVIDPVKTLEPIPTVGMMYSQYFRNTEKLNVLSMQVKEERKIKTMNLEIYDQQGMLIFEEKNKPYANNVDFDVPSATLPAGQFVRVVVTYNIELDNKDKMAIKAEQTLYTGVNSPAPTTAFADFETDSVMKLDKAYNVTYYADDVKVDSEKTKEITFDESFSKVVIDNGEEKFEINNNKYVAPTVEVQPEVAVSMVNDAYVIEPTASGKVVIENKNATKFEKILGLDKKTYNSKQLEALSIPKDEIENYNIYEKGDVNEKN